MRSGGGGGGLDCLLDGESVGRGSGSGGASGGRSEKSHDVGKLGLQLSSLPLEGLLLPEDLFLLFELILEVESVATEGIDYLDFTAELVGGVEAAVSVEELVIRIKVCDESTKKLLTLAMKNEYRFSVF